MTEINRAPLGITEPAVVQHLQQHIEHIRMGLLHLIKQQQGIGTATHGLRELTAFLVAHIAGRGAEQTGHSVALHELTHVETHHRLLFIKELTRQSLSQLGLAHTGRSHEKEGPHRPARILHPGTGPADRSRHGLHGLRLPDHPLLQPLIQLQQFLPLASQQPLDWDPRPARHHIGNIRGLHLFP